MINVLITGGYGFLGRYTALKFKNKKSCRIVGIGFGSWNRENYKAFGFDKWVEAEVSFDILSNLQERFDIIVHCAGTSLVTPSIANPIQEFRKTVNSTIAVLDYIRLSGVPTRLIYPSSAGVYGSKADKPIKETDSLNPISPYGYYKKMVEELCECYSMIFGVNVAVLRFFSIYGVGIKKQLLWDASNKMAVANGEAIFWGTGEETRDWINIEDATELILKISASNECFTVINGANGARVTVRAFLEMLRDEMASGVKITFNNTVREGDPRFYHADISKANKLGWAPTISLHDGIGQYVAWFKERNRD